MDSYIEKYKKKTKNSMKLFKKLSKTIPGGVSHNIRFFPPYPIFIEKCIGSKIYDVDGNEYIDLWMGHYSHILGHTPEVVKKATLETINLGIHSGCVNPYEVSLAEKINRLIPSAESIRFCCSGTEATTYSVRLSRAFTGKSIVLKVAGGWHGAGSELTKAIKFPYNQYMSKGIPEDLLSKTDYIFFNDIDKTYKVLKKHKNNIACVILEPVIGEGGFLPAKKEYLEFLREETNSQNSVLIFDEIITGFRLGLNGAQGYYNIIPDLTTLGKIAGGGFNIGIIAGKKDILEISSHDYKGKNKVLIGGGTFSETPYAMRAGYAVIDFLEKNPDVYSDIDKKGKYIRNEINNFIKKKNLKAIITGIGSLYMIHFPIKKGIKINSPEDIGKNTDIPKREYEFKLRLINEGIYVMHGGGALSYAHSNKEIDQIIEKTCKVLNEMNLQN